MKKLLIAFSLLLIMTGCDEKTENLSCKSTTTANGMTTNTTYDIEYANDDVKYVTITYDYSQGTRTRTNDMDGVNADTDGISERNNTNENNNRVDSDEVVDGIVGDVIDETVEGVTETILDIAGIKNRYENQLTMYDDIEGFSYDVDIDNANQYKIIYKIDMNKISDDDLSRFDVTRNFSDIRTNYEDLGYTCK